MPARRMDRARYGHGCTIGCAAAALAGADAGAAIGVSIQRVGCASPMIHATTSIAITAKPAMIAQIHAFTKALLRVCNLPGGAFTTLAPPLHNPCTTLALGPSPSIASPAMEHENASPSPEWIVRLAERIDRPIVLVGLMGVGKTTVGRRLAAMLGQPFRDADDEIERAAQMSIPEIFATYGEAYFRSGERRVIARLVGETGGPSRHVLATGGGAFVDPETRALILRCAVAVWLDSDVDTLVARVGRKSNRPLLRTGNPREILTRLKAERESAYAEAPIHVTSGNQPHPTTALAILKAIDAWL